jgi:hypothetical protein
MLAKFQRMGEMTETDREINLREAEKKLSVRFWKVSMMGHLPG